MGAWGALAFENDNASDWVWTLEEAEDTSVLTDALQAVISQDEVSEDWEEALAAAEVVAALLGKPLPKLDDEVVSYVERIGKKPSSKLAKLSVAAVNKVANTLALQKAWKPDLVAAWQNSMQDLLSRLGEPQAH